MDFNGLPLVDWRLFMRDVFGYVMIGILAGGIGYGAGMNQPKAPSTAPGGRSSISSELRDFPETFPAQGGMWLYRRTDGTVELYQQGKGWRTLSQDEFRDNFGVFRPGK